MKQPERERQLVAVENAQSRQETPPVWAEMACSPIDKLLITPLNDSLKVYLTQLMENAAVCGLAGSAVLDVCHQFSELRRLCDVLAAMKRELAFDEKKYLFAYLAEAVADGYAFDEIGFNDAVLAKLTIATLPKQLSELEVQPLLAHNQDIFEFARRCEGEAGFYELTAARLVQCEPVFLQTLKERCFALLNTEQPRGVMFALALLNLKQAKTAVMLLTELAKRGQITAMTGYLHRLFEAAKGAEALIAGLLKLNLRRQDEGLSYQKEFIARRYLSAVRCFCNFKFFQPAAELLAELATGGWFDGVTDFKRDVTELAEEIFAGDGNLTSVLKPVRDFLSPTDGMGGGGQHLSGDDAVADVFGFRGAVSTITNKKAVATHIMPNDYGGFGQSGGEVWAAVNDDGAAVADVRVSLGARISVAEKELCADEKVACSVGQATFVLSEAQKSQNNVDSLKPIKQPERAAEIISWDDTAEIIEQELALTDKPVSLRSFLNVSALEVDMQLAQGKRK